MMLGTPQIADKHIMLESDAGLVVVVVVEGGVFLCINDDLVGGGLGCGALIIS